MSLANLPLYQRVYSKDIKFINNAGSLDVQLPLYYEVSDGDQNLGGLTLNIHYNSSLLKSPTVANQHSEMITKATILKDTQNLDSDLSTDSIFQLLWMSFDSSFPGIPLPALLGSVQFKTNVPLSSPTDPLALPIASSSPLSTTVRYTASESNYEFLEDSTVIDTKPPVVEPPSLYCELITDRKTVSEGETIKATVKSNLAPGTTLYYSWGGNNISYSDFTYDGNLYGGVGSEPRFARWGEILVGADGTATFSQTLDKDQFTEGTEYVEIQLYTDFDKTKLIGNLLKIEVLDTSVAPPPIDPIPDYSNDPLNPTPVQWASTAVRQQGISNSVGGTDSADYLTFKVPVGQRLTGITLTSYNSTDGKAFIGLQKGAQVTASSAMPGPLIGYTHFGYGQSDAVVGTNLISMLGGVLTEGTYSIWIQQLGAKTDYSFNLELQDNPTFNEHKSVVLPLSPTGTKVTIADTSSPDVVATSQNSPDLIEIQAPVRAMLNALTSETHGVGVVARNVGTKTTAGTGQMVSMKGLGKYTFVATAIPEATTTINLEPAKDTAFFLHDAYSAFYTGLTLTPDSTGRQSHQRVLNVDTIFMGSGGGTSIVDLTSKDYVTGAVTVYGADKGRSIFWGTDANDTFISGGGDSVIFGGAGSNAATLGAGRDILQYRAGVGAVDRVEGFDRTKDAVELWIGKEMVTIEPQFTSVNGSTTMKWGGNTIEFVGIPDLTLSNLQIFNRVA